MTKPLRSCRTLIAFATFAAACASALAFAPSSPDELASIFNTEVDRRLDVPPQELQRYANLAEQAFAQASVMPVMPQYVVVVDRNPHVQALLLMWRSMDGEYQLAGASPVSTGRPGTFDHFQTPLGVFEHTPSNMDYRAEGTYNENGIRGYGVQGMRVFDYGWQQVPKGWGDHAVIQMRLQMHATDPDQLEQRVGTIQSEGCVRIPASLNRFIDHYGLLDAEYDELAEGGQRLKVLQMDREPVADAGRYMVVVDSGRGMRPAWATHTGRRRPTS
ncbi:L,D-transpeptidase [Ramlibacter sp. G-1-2-2]|uniref:L,D-transpeptidase n=1 Tax=Ramlibacter agri TaxID=2728837 RepID=A0A848H0Z7_9BURK|nr:L,D-transpeptidase [Ramlibacter agri]NML43302.1 L,D-transpeptidase [Ramlibacter agri]